MKKMKKTMAAFALGLISVTFTSCYSTTTCVGTITEDAPSVKVNTVKNHFLIDGLIPISKTNLADSKYIGTRKNYKVKKSLTFVDGLLRVLTLGIYSPSTTTYYIPLEDLEKKSL